MEAHHAHADAALSLSGIFGAGHFVGCAVDIILQNIVEEAHDVFDELFFAFPLFPLFEVERGQAAHRRAIIAEVVDAGRQSDFGAQIGSADFQAQIAVMLGHHAVHRVGEHDVGLACGKAGFNQLLEQAARIDFAAHTAILG